MPELTLESLAARVAVLERAVADKLNVIPPTRDWRTVVGIFEGNAFSKEVDAEMAAAREAERQALSVEAVEPGIANGVVAPVRTSSFLTKWAGAIRTDVPDWADDHDRYLGEAQAKDVAGGGDDGVR